MSLINLEILAGYCHLTTPTLQAKGVATWVHLVQGLCQQKRFEAQGIRREWVFFYCFCPAPCALSLEPFPLGSDSLLLWQWKNFLSISIASNSITTFFLATSSAFL
jgi:hypothetical protein